MGNYIAYPGGVDTAEKPEALNVVCPVCGCPSDCWCVVDYFFGPMIHKAREREVEKKNYISPPSEDETVSPRA